MLCDVILPVEIQTVDLFSITIRCKQGGGEEEEGRARLGRYVATTSVRCSVANTGW